MSLNERKIIGFQVIDCLIYEKKQEWQDEIIRLLRQGWEFYGGAVLPTEYGPYMYHAQALILREK